MQNKSLLTLGILISGVAHGQTAPVAEKHPYVVKSPFGDRQDEYYWLRDDNRENPKMLDYLKAENKYADELLAPLKPLEDEIYKEIVSRIKQDDSALAIRTNGYWYYSRYETGKNYPIRARIKDKQGLTAKAIYEKNLKGDFEGEEILLDVNKLSVGHKYYQADFSDISKDNKTIVWWFDTTGRRQRTIQITDLSTGKTLPDTITNTTGEAVISGNSVIYIEKDPTTLLGNKVKQHFFGTKQSDDKLLYEEKDNSFYMGIGTTRDKKYFVISTESTTSNELMYAPINAPDQLKSLAKREPNVEYRASHYDNQWYIQTNIDGATNFKIMRAPDGTTSRDQWKEWLPYDPNVSISNFSVFKDYIVTEERADGLTNIRIINRHNLKSHYIKNDADTYTVELGANPESDNPWIRYYYTTMVTPSIAYELNLDTNERRTIKETKVPNYNPNNYETKRLWVDARDGTKVPVSIAYKKGFKRDGTASLLQYGYGSYGSSMDPYFSIGTVSLLDRGMIYAMAHVRGGEEMGRKWYEDGKLLKKKNTFTDFIDVTRYLVKEKYAAKDKVAALGGSAGGLLMGAISNMANKDYRVVLSIVPFVDVVTTMLDESIPLTTNEYDEWGNPGTSKESYDYMLSYSPYDNISNKEYPAMFVSTGLWDSQVQYWEPTKYVARLRAHNQSKLPIVFRINMDAGHGGKSGRFAKYRETAEMYAFMLDQLGLNDQKNSTTTK